MIYPRYHVRAHDHRAQPTKAPRAEANMVNIMNYSNTQMKGLSNGF